MAARLADIFRYPVKGLSAEKLGRVALTAGCGLPHDRRFAIARGAIDFDAAHPTWLQKTNFYMLMRDETLARLRTAFDGDSGILTISRDGQEALRADITSPSGRAAVEAFLSEFLGAAAEDRPPRLLEAPGHMFGDASPKEGAATDKYVSLIGLSSIGALERHAGSPVDPIRFRANLYVEGTEPWEEFAWVGRTIAIGAARLHVLAPITRCAATQVNPATAARDLNIPKLLQQGFGHIHMGVYAEVTAGGDIAQGDHIVSAA